MKISMDILAEELKGILNESHLMDDTQMDLVGVRFLNDNTDFLTSNLLYVGTQFPNVWPEPFNMLYLGKLPEKIPESCNILAVREEIKEDILFNRVLNIFQKYNDWEEKMSLLLREHAPLEDFLNLSQPIFKSGICIMDWNHNVVAVTRIKMENCPLWDSILDGYGYKYKFVIEHSNPKLKDITQSRNMCQNWSNLDNRYLYNLPLFINGYAMFGIALHKIENPQVPFGKDISQLYNEFGKIIFQRLNYSEKTQTKHSALQNLFIRDIIIGRVEDPDELNKQNNYIPIEQGDCLTVGVIILKNEKFQSSFLVNRCKELESMQPGSICCINEYELIWVINLKKCEDIQWMPGNEKKRMEQYLRNNDAYCGFSQVFSSLAHIKQGYQQAVSTLHFGMLLDDKEENRIFYYYDHLDYQIIQQASKTMDVTTLLHPALRILLCFDRNHKTNYYETLREYLLDDCETTFNGIADRLHIHRNTLHYRIDKIQKITGISLEDLTEKRQLILSLICTDEKSPWRSDGQRRV